VTQPRFRTTREQRIWEATYAAQFVNTLQIAERHEGDWDRALKAMTGITAIEAANRAVECYRRYYCEGALAPE
jgi:hypothetical protein